MALAGTPRRVTPCRLAGVAWLAPVLAAAALVALAAPAQSQAQAQYIPYPTDTGGVEVLDTPDDGGTSTFGPYDWPGDDDTVTSPDPLPFLDPLQPQFDPAPALLAPVATTYVAGKLARLRTDGKAAIPRGAPKRVRSLIRQYNRIVGKRYLWGGGHMLLEDKGYDCSGAVGYGLVRTGMLRSTLVSGSFARWAAAGPGRWMTVYANRTHVYTEVAGLRLDTSPYGDVMGASGVRWRPLVGQRVGFKVRHPVGL
jgi:cell wall-associated NlpC family hydrolase